MRPTDKERNYLSKKEIIEKLRESTGLTKVALNKVFNDTVAIMSDALADGTSVRIDKIGNFVFVEDKDIKTKDPYDAKNKAAVEFEISPTLYRHINYPPTVEKRQNRLNTTSENEE